MDEDLLQLEVAGGDQHGPRIRMAAHVERRRVLFPVREHDAVVVDRRVVLTVDRKRVPVIEQVLGDGDDELKEGVVLVGHGGGWRGWRVGLLLLVCAVVCRRI